MGSAPPTSVRIGDSDIPAVTHVDYSARIQTVHHETNPRYCDLIAAFKARAGCPAVVNTSFNVRGEPIRPYA
jgi:carbamoyltransferase